MKTNELSGAALDWAVAKAEGDELTCKSIQYPEYAKHYPKVSPSTNWALGGPIIEREQIAIWPESHDGVIGTENSKQWLATMYYNGGEQYTSEPSPSPLEAAMRCYVASKLGDEVQLPEELK